MAELGDTAQDSAPAFEEARVSCDWAPSWARQARDLVRERLLANDDVRVGPTNKQAAAARKIEKARGS